MSCTHYQRLMHLNRSGEISGAETDDLRQHVRLCERCALELQDIERADEFIDRLAASSPHPANPEKLTADIMNRVSAESAVSASVSSVDRFLDFFLTPAVRYATLAIILAVTVVSMTQVVMVLTDVSDLEQRMATSARSDVNEATYTVHSKTLQEVTESENGKSLRENFSLTVRNGRIDVPAQEVEPLLSGSPLKNLPIVMGATAFRIDPKILAKIVNEVTTTAELTFHVRHEGV